MSRAARWRLRSCSQILNTYQPARRNVRVTTASRARLPESFRRQNARLYFGFVACLGQPCQKHPSTNTASLSFRKTKSGLPNTGWLRRQPVMPCRRHNFASASSVSLFPRPRIRDNHFRPLRLGENVSHFFLTTDEHRWTQIQSPRKNTKDAKHFGLRWQSRKAGATPLWVAATPRRDSVQPKSAATPHSAFRTPRLNGLRPRVWREAQTEPREQFNLFSGRNNSLFHR